MGKRYYELDKNGKYTASYARNQPGKNLTLLEESPNQFSKWDGEQWVDDIEQYINIKIPDIRNIVLNNWIDSPRSITQIKERYDLFKSQSLTWTTVSQVDTEIDNFITWLDYE